MRNCVMVAPATLTRIVRVRILLPQPNGSICCRFSTGYSADGSALRSGRRGLEFKSQYSDHTGIHFWCVPVFCSQPDPQRGPRQKAPFRSAGLIGGQIFLRPQIRRDALESSIPQILQYAAFYHTAGTPEQTCARYTKTHCALFRKRAAIS